MATFHFHSQIIKRSAGKSATGASAYRAGEKIEDRRTGKTFDYTKKKGVDFSKILAPSNAKEWVFNRAELWNKVEEHESRKDAQLCREVEISLPVELTQQQQIDLALSYAQEQFVSKGMIADCCFHKLNDHSGNPHCHILLSMRELKDDGFGKKLESDWSKRGEILEGWRSAWAEHANSALERNGHNTRIDHRTLLDQKTDALENGQLEIAEKLNRSPTVHEGYGKEKYSRTHAENKDATAQTREMTTGWNEIKIQAGVSAMQNGEAGLSGKKLEQIQSGFPSVGHEQDQERTGGKGEKSKQQVARFTRRRSARHTVRAGAGDAERVSVEMLNAQIERDDEAHNLFMQGIEQSQQAMMKYVEQMQNDQQVRAWANAGETLTARNWQYEDQRIERAKRFIEERKNEEREHIEKLRDLKNNMKIEQAEFEQWKARNEEPQKRKMWMDNPAWTEWKALRDRAFTPTSKAQKAYTEAKAKDAQEQLEIGKYIAEKWHEIERATKNRQRISFLPTERVEIKLEQQKRDQEQWQEQEFIETMQVVDPSKPMVKGMNV